MPMFDPQLPIAELMRAQVHYLAPTDLLADALAIFDKHQVNHLPVCAQGKVVGMLSRHDTNRLQHSFTAFGTAESQQFNKKIVASLIVKDVMTKGVVTLGINQTIQDAAAVFKTSAFHSLVIVAEDGQTLAGIVTVMDLLHYAYS
ncbi:MAG: CBS domain-containing protein [Lewinella sp.]|nr:CBS domain-containing protein [Lewinella sp.]